MGKLKKQLDTFLRKQPKLGKGVYIAKGASYGNLAALRTAANAIYDESSGQRGNACATGCVKHTRTDGLTYADDTVNWRLGRLTASSAHHTRYNDQGVALATKTVFGEDMLAAAGVDWKAYTRTVGERASAQRITADRKRDQAAKA